MKCHATHLTAKGIIFNSNGDASIRIAELDIIVSNDEFGKMVSVVAGDIQFSFDAQELAEYLK